jgi:hypothetical protein
MCKGYGAKVLIQAEMTISTNNTDKDIIPHLSLEYDSCEPDERKISLNNIHLDLPLKNIINHLDDLRIASRKVDEAERLISEQEWKVKHSNVDYHLSFITYVGMVTTGIVMITFCYCCCRC